MRQYLVVAHQTLGGAELKEHLRSLRDEDPATRFHVVVPSIQAIGWSDGEAQKVAERALAKMLDELRSEGLEATGEVGNSNPVFAVARVLRREADGAFAGIVLSTQPQGVSRWLGVDVPRRMARAYPKVPITHIVAEEPLPIDELARPTPPTEPGGPSMAAH